MATPDITQLATTLAQLAEQLAHQPAEPTQPPEPEPAAAPQRVLLTVEEAAEQLSIGRTHMYTLIRSGEVTSVRIGNLRRVPADEIAAYVQRLTEQIDERQAAA